MKTLTEFPGISLKNAAKVKQDLTTSGKTAEEIPQALGETLKIEGDRLKFLVTSLEIINTRLQDLKRVVVFSLNEGEAAPAGTIQKENHTYLVEYYSPLAGKNDQKSADQQQDQRPGKRGRGGKGRNDRRNDRKPSDNKSFRPRGPKPTEAGSSGKKPVGTGPKIVIAPKSTPPQTG